MKLNKYVFLGISFFLGVNSIKCSDIEDEKYGRHFNKLSTETKEEILSHLSLVEWSRLAKTCKAWHQTVDSFVSLPAYQIDLSTHFKNGKNFNYLCTQSSFWVLAQECRNSNNSQINNDLVVLKISSIDLQETVINLSEKMGWGKEVNGGSEPCPEVPPFTCSACPQGGIFVYAPRDARNDIVYISEAGDICSQSLLKNYNGMRTIVACSSRHLAVDSSEYYEFIPYLVDVDGTIDYYQESFAYAWPRYQKVYEWNYEHKIRARADYFLIDIIKWEIEFDCNFKIRLNHPFPFKHFVINPEDKENMIREHGNMDYSPRNSSADSIMSKTVLPEGYSLIEYEKVVHYNLLFLYGRKVRQEPPQAKNSISESTQDLEDGKEELQYPYGVLLIKNLKNSEPIGKKLLCDDTQASEPWVNSMRIVNPYLFIAVDLKNCSTPKITAINFGNIQRLLGYRGT